MDFDPQLPRKTANCVPKASSRDLPVAIGFTAVSEVVQWKQKLYDLVPWGR